MRLGGAIISLILPKLIRSWARDGIVLFQLAGNPPDRCFSVATQGKQPALAGNLPNFNFQFRCYDFSELPAAQFLGRLQPSSPGTHPGARTNAQSIRLRIRGG